MRERLYLLALIVLTALTAVAQKQEGNFSYFLPKTEIRIALLIEKTTFTPGKLAEYADIYFKADAEQSAGTRYRLTGVTFSTAGLPDYDKQHDLLVDKKHSIISIDCDKNGVLKAINTTTKDMAEPVPFTPAPKAKQPNPRNYMSQDILATQSLPKMAQLVAQEIYDIRDSRNQLARGEAEFMPRDGEQLRLMLSQLDTQEQALMSLFEGTTSVDTTEIIIRFVPEKDMSKQTLFRFSPKFGLTSADDLSAAPYYVIIDDEYMTLNPPAVSEEAKKQKDDLLVAVNIPGKIKISISDGSTTLCEYSTYVAQFGYEEMLPGSLFGKKLTSKLVLDTVTGAVVRLETEPLE